MSINILIFLVLTFAILFLFFYMFMRDKAIDKKFMLISTALEDINNEIYKLQKQQKANSLDVEKIVSERLDEVLDSLIQTIKETQYKNQKEIEILYNKISKIEGDVKNFSLPNFNSMIQKDDKKEEIKSLYEIGWSVEDIAKQLNMNVGEVSFFLNLIQKP